ncbi:MAG: hypothetical protein R3F11_10960 [Verrucomicrobiales bacterium]
MRAGQRTFEDLDLGSDPNPVVEVDDILRLHPDAAVADGKPDISLLWGAVDVDESVIGTLVSLLFAAQPDDPGDDWIAPRRIRLQDFAGKLPAFENRAERRAAPIFLATSRRPSGVL